MALTQDRTLLWRAVPTSQGFGFKVAAGYRVWRDGIVACCADGTLVFDTAPTFPNLGAAVYAIDDERVSLSSNSNARLQIGTLDGFDTDGTPYTRIS